MPHHPFSYYSRLILCSLTLLMSHPLLAADPPADQADQSAPTDTAPTLPPAVKRYTTQQQDLMELHPDQGLWVDVDGAQIAGLYIQETRGTDLGGILLLPDVGTTCNWPELIGPLRQALPEHGWHTLAVTPPMSSKQAPRYIKKSASQTEAEAPADTTNEPAANDTPPTTTPTATKASKSYSTHIQAGLKAFGDKGINNAVMLGRGEGAYWALKHAVDNPARGLVIIDIRQPAAAEESIADLLAKLNTPTLDAFYNQQSRNAQTRANLARLNSGLNYRQMHINAPTGSALPPHHPLIKVIVGWAKKNL